MRLRAVVVLLILGLACTEEKPAAKSPTNAPSPPTPVVVAPAASDGGAIALKNPDGLDGAPMTAEWLKDGTLVVSSDKEVLTLDTAGKIRHLVSHGRQVKMELWGRGEAFALESEHDAVLMDGTFRELWKGDATSLTTPGDALASEKEVVVYRGGKLLRLQLPAAQGRHVDSLTIVAGGKSAIVAWTNTDSAEQDAALFEVASGKHLGKVFSNAMFTMRPIATNDDKLQYGITDATIKVIDLETGSSVRTGKVVCGKDQFVGNPMISPTGDTLLVTCGDDGLVLDSKTFAVRRRLTRIIPGCDNGDILPARFEKASPQLLVVEGCGGEARLELSTGKYKCSDDVGLVGAPYEMGIPPVMPTRGQPGRPMAVPPQRRAPAGRENLPRCTPVDQMGMQPSSISGNAAYKQRYGENNEMVIEHANGKFALEEGAHSPVLSPDVTKLAYMRKDRVVIRALPAGTVVREITAR